MNTSSPTMARPFSWRNWFSLRGEKCRASAAESCETVQDARIPSSAPRILVVDDDEVVRKTTEIRLKAHGYAVTTAADGPAAIHAARTERPDLILLDVCFPPDVSLTWDGFRIMTWLKRLECTKDTPMIVFTGSVDRGVAQRALQVGVDGFFHKPLNFSALLALMDYRLNRAAPARTAPVGVTACEI